MKNIYIALALISTSIASCPDLPNYVTSIAELHKDICNYAGYVPNSPYFYWFMIKRDYTRLIDVPLFIHIGGGIESSLLNIFQNGGPYRLRYNELSNTNESLLDIGNVVYVEAKGMFSLYQDLKQCNIYALLNEYKEFIDSFIKHNELFGLSNVFIISDEQTTKLGVILELASLEAIEYKIKGLIINNGRLSIHNYIDSTSKLTERLNIIPPDLLAKLTEETYIPDAMGLIDPKEAFSRWNLFSYFVANVSGLVNFMNDIRNTSLHNEVKDIEKFLSRDDVQKALHVPKFVQWQSKISVLECMLPAILNATQEEYKEAAKHFRILFNVGTYSTLTSVNGFHQWASSWNKELLKQNRKFMNNANIYIKNKDNTTYAIYTNEGKDLGKHSLHSYLSVIDHFVHNRTLKTLDEDDSSLIHIMQHCNQHGEFDKIEKKCKCGSGYYGADCSMTLTNIDSKIYRLLPRQWQYFKITQIEGVRKYRASSNECQVMIALNFGLSTLPTKNNNDILTVMDEITFEKDKESEAILGIHNMNAYQSCNIILEERSMNEGLFNLTKAMLVIVLLLLILLIIGAVIIFYRLMKRDKQRLSDIKV